MNVSDQELLLFIMAIKSASNYDFSEYSDKSLKRRIAKVLTDNKLDIYSLIANIRSNRDFLEKVVKDITVNTTELFRDPQIWQNLRYKILPKLAENKTLNIWHAGCSSGQEVYSMMILLNEMNLLDKAKIYASDLNVDMLDQSKKGLYKYRFNITYLDNFDKVIKENPFNYEQFNDVPYSKYFEIDKIKDTIKMHPFLTEKPIFKKHDLVNDGNTFFVKFDLILCRNVIIYFNYDLQNKVFDLFYNSLFSNSWLLLGMHETILGPHANKFDKQGQFYSRRDEPRPDF
jgi:chemotaxis protein methyltransferase CheR